jgi:large subunit ribosomal protein L22
MAFGAKTNERPGVRCQVKYVRTSAYKAREVLDLIRGLPVARALEVLELAERDIARVILKGLESAIANAEHNNSIPADELFVSACFADEGPTLKRWRPRARGRATRIRKRTSHITIIVSRLSTEDLEALRERESASGRVSGGRAAAEARRERVARSRSAKAARKVEAEAEHDHEHEHDHGDEHDHDHDHDDELVETEPTAEVDDVVEADDVVEDVADDAADAVDADGKEI